MNRTLTIGAVAGALLLLGVVAGGPAQAAPVSGLSAIPGSALTEANVVDKAGWRRWRYHRNWWWRWRRW